ncbi:MAG: Kelch repeat-containing protein [Acidimicrobiales bacterium]
MDCHAPVCPKCLVRTEVGTKCQSCAAPAEVRVTRVPRSKKPLAAVVGGAAVVVAIVVALVVTQGGGSSNPTAALPPVGHWTSESPLGSIRGTAAVVTLANGTVLAAGGGVGQLPVASTEIFSTTTAKWSPTGQLNVPRRGASAVVLADGRVLVTGGISGPQILASSEVYDPATGKWALVGSMSTPRLDNTLTLLPSGKVLAAGGTTQSGTAGTGAGQTIIPVASAELFDPATGRWTPTGSMSAARFEASGTSLADGRVLVAGGLGGAGTPGANGLTYPPLTSAEIYDPAVGAFTGAGRMATARAYQVAARLSDGTVIVAGGAGGADGLTTLGGAERFDPANGSWRTLTSMTSPRTGAAATTLKNGDVLVAGGESGDQGSTSSLASAEVYQPAKGVWRSAGKMPCARSGLGAAGLSDGSVLEVAGDTAFPGQPPVAQGCVDRYYPSSTG